MSKGWEAKVASAREHFRALAAVRAHWSDWPEELELADPGALWDALVEGRWSVFDSFDADGRCCFVARRNAPHVQASLALSAAEREVIVQALRGCANKVIAAEMLLAESTVATHLASAMRKLGVPNRTELVAMLGALTPRSTG